MRRWRAAARAQLQRGMQGGGAKGGAPGGGAKSGMQGMPVVARNIADVLAQDIGVSEAELRKGLVLAMESSLLHLPAGQ